jgi:Flp pilus assembly protein TadG
VYYWDGSAPAGHRLRDISSIGAYLYTSERWYPGTIIRLLVQEDHEPPIGGDTAHAAATASVPSKVVRHGSDGVALEFFFRNADDRQVFLELIASMNGQAPAVAAKPIPEKRSRRGQALVELALMVPLIFLLIVNAVNFGGFMFAWITVANAARAGADYWTVSTAAIGTPAATTAAQVTTLVTNDISSLLSRSTLVVRVCKNNNSVVTCSGSGSGTPPADPEPLTYISASVDVTYTYTPPIALWHFSGLGITATLPPTTIHRQAVMRMLQ